MNFIKFPVGATNIFPLANSTAGGQLLTEFNLRSRESVGTHSAVKYMVGPSFAHSMDDYAISKSTESSAVIEVSRGRALVNGHFVETLASMTVDINEANLDLKTAGQDVLKGRLCIGIRAMYSTIQTDAARANAMKIENSDDYYEGVQLVVLPKDGPLGKRLTLPEDSPADESKVTAHLKLGEFDFINGTIKNVEQNDLKCQYIDAGRLSNITNLLSDEYLKKTGLNQDSLYVYGGYGSDPALDTWCEAQDSLIVWDNSPNLVQGNIPSSVPKSATFQLQSGSGATVLTLPHKQPDGMTNKYYKPKTLALPLASFSKETGGTVDKTFISNIKAIDEKVSALYSMPGGKLRKYIANLYSVDDRSIKIVKDTPIDPTWDIGDYILVGVDNTVTYSDSAATFRSPSTLYPVIPGYVTDIESSSKSAVSGLTMIRKESVSATDPDYASGVTLASAKKLLGLENGQNGDRGDNRYYYLIERLNDDNTVASSHYFKVKSSTEREYAGIAEGTDPIILTGEVPLATEDAVGGFLNVDSGATGVGYVRRNDEGHLEIIDWDILVSGVLAYQLGQDVEVPKGYSIEAIQEQLDEYVNERVAFPNAAQITAVSAENANVAANEMKRNPNQIKVVINLPDSDDDGDDPQTLMIRDIDSRFGGWVDLYLKGPASSNLTIFINNCQKVKLNLGELSGEPQIVLNESCLYYDSHVLNQLNAISGLSLWYTKLSNNDPDLIVDSMTVTLADRPDVIVGEDYWSVNSPNDNHYSYALRSLTFAKDGTVVGCSLLVGDNITPNNETGEFAYMFEFNLPQSIGLSYPETKLTKQLKVTGQFVSAYEVSSPRGYMIKDTSFTALTQAYKPTDTTGYVKGTIGFLLKAYRITSISGISPVPDVDCWQTGKLNVFYGGTAE